jgi:hypothetical protein
MVARLNKAAYARYRAVPPTLGIGRRRRRWMSEASSTSIRTCSAPKLADRSSLKTRASSFLDLPLSLRGVLS